MIGTDTQSSPVEDMEKEHRAKVFSAKMGTITHLFQNTLHQRALEVENQREKIRLLKCHAEVSRVVERLIG